MANSDSPVANAPAATDAQDNKESKGLGFAVLCVQKAVEFNVKDHKLHRATKDKELHEEMEKLTDAGPSTFLYQLGGGCRVVGPTGAGGAPIYSACVGDAVCAFQGLLSNLADLAHHYVPEPQEGPGKATPAEVICNMYLQYGVELLTKLRGRFAFCMYESKQGRVLAARDGSGAVHLYQGHSPTQGLVISSTRAFLGTCSDIKEFNRGDFKYGWHSEPRQFSPIEFSRRGRQSNAEGGRRGSLDCATGERHSIDMSNMNHHHQEGGGSRRSMDTGRRGSMDRSRRSSLERGGRAPSIDGNCTWNKLAAANASNGSVCPPSGGRSSMEGGRRSMEGGRRSMEGKYVPPGLAKKMASLSVDAPEFNPQTGTTLII